MKKEITTFIYALGIAMCIMLLLFACSPIRANTGIPAGEYTLTAARDFKSLGCGMAESTFGNTLLIHDGIMETHPLKGIETVVYLIKKITDSDYLAQVHRPVWGDTVTIEFTHNPGNGQLCFSCSGEKIIYQK